MTNMLPSASSMQIPLALLLWCSSTFAYASLRLAPHPDSCVYMYGRLCSKTERYFNAVAGLGGALSAVTVLAIAAGMDCGRARIAACAARLSSIAALSTVLCSTVNSMQERAVMHFMIVGCLNVVLLSVVTRRRVLPVAGFDVVRILTKKGAARHELGRTALMANVFIGLVVLTKLTVSPPLPTDVETHTPILRDAYHWYLHSYLTHILTSLLTLLHGTREHCRVMNLCSLAYTVSLQALDISYPADDHLLPKNLQFVYTARGLSAMIAAMGMCCDEVRGSTPFTGDFDDNGKDEKAQTDYKKND